jgi:hypothetical protein
MLVLEAQKAKVMKPFFKTTLIWDLIAFEGYAAVLLCNYLFFLFLLVGLGFELRALDLQSRCSTAWATPPHAIIFWLLSKEY